MRCHALCAGVKPFLTTLSDSSMEFPFFVFFFFGLRIKKQKKMQNEVNVFIFFICKNRFFKLVGKKKNGIFFLLLLPIPKFRKNVYIFTNLITHLIFEKNVGVDILFVL